MYKGDITEEHLVAINNNASDLGMKFKFCVLKSNDAKNVSDFPFFYKYSVRNQNDEILIDVTASINY
jgi:hypothetical protein